MGQVLKRYRKLPKSPLFGLITALVVLSMSIMAGLRADANPMPTQTLSGSITTSQTLNPGFVYIVESGVTVEGGATLTIPAGTIVKYGINGLITIEQGSSLRVTGTSASPAYFTSIKDDTVGGDTNGDGNATSPAIDDFDRAIMDREGSINIVFAKFNYVAMPITASQQSGSIVVTDCIFNNNHIAIIGSAPTIKLYRNTFNNLQPYDYTGGVVLSEMQDLTKISLSGIDQNIFTGTNKHSRNIRIGRATLPEGKAWNVSSTSGATVYFSGHSLINGTATFGPNTSMIHQGVGDSALRIKGTLNIQEGVWVKSGWNKPIKILPAGKLNVIGSATNPVRFTNFKDDTVGGDTNGDGPSAPREQDYSGMIFDDLSVGYPGSISIAHARFTYFNSAISTHLQSVSITDTSFSNGAKAMHIYDVESLSLQRNTFNVKLPITYAEGAIEIYSTDISGVSLAGSNRNIFMGSQRDRAISFNRSKLSVGKTMDIDAASGGIFSTREGDIKIDGTLNLGKDTEMSLRSFPSYDPALSVQGTINIYEGVIGKFAPTSGIAALEGGNINVYGTAAKKVHFTSIKDDTIGGDANQDGTNSVPSAYEINSFISLAGGTAYVMHASFNYANYAISGSSSNSLKIFDSSFKNTGSAIYAQVPNVKIYRNEFNTMPYGSMKGAIELTEVQDISRVGFSGSDQNFFNGTSNISRVVRFQNSKLPVDRSLTVSQASGAALRLSGGVDIHGNLTMAANTMLIADEGWLPSPNIYGTLTMQTGGVIKSLNSSGISVKNGAKVNLIGNSSNKIKITHLYNDEVGGDTNGDGAATTPTSGGYNGFTIDEGGVLAASHIDASYANTIFSQSGGRVTVDNARSTDTYNFLYMGDGEATVTNTSIQGGRQGVNVNRGYAIFRGSISGQQDFAIRACTWSTQNCSVDAAYVDWGTGGAPATGSVCGQVTVSPWVGGSASSNGLFTSKNCDNSPTPADQLSSSTQHFGQRMSVRGIDCGNGFEDACEAMRRARTCLSGAVSVAGSTSPFPLPGSEPHEQVNTWGQSLADGATTYIQAIESPTPQLSALQFGSKLLGALNTMVSISGAYMSCAP